MSQVLSEPSRNVALLNLLSLNRERLLGAAMIGGCLDHSGDKMADFNLFCVMIKRGNQSGCPGFQEDKLQATQGAT